MKYLRLLFYILFFSKAMLTWAVDDIGGMSFRSYEYSKDERTSFIIPSGNQDLKLKKYFSLSFDLKIRQQGEHFGYVCRMIIDNKHSLNLVLVNPVKEDPYLCFIKDQQYLGKVHSQKDANIYKWNKLKIELKHEGDSLYIKNNGLLLYKEADVARSHSVRICFGANKLVSYNTSDVAPIILKDVNVSFAPDCVKHEWPLRQAVSDTLLQDKSQRLTAFISNPDWNIHKHMYWKHMKTLSFSSKTYPVKDELQSVCYFIAKDRIVRYNPVQNTTKEYVFSPDIDVDRITNQFLCVPLKAGGSQLAYYDFEKPDGENLSFFDFQTMSWSIPIRRNRQSSYTQHNRFFNEKDSSIVQMLGYGFHSYTRELNRISLSGEIVRGELPSAITPRYLSAIGKTDSVVYIYGGLGNDLGKQEFGVTHYKDLYKLNLGDYSLKKMWTMTENTHNEVVASTLVMDETNDMHAKGLFFTPSRFSSALVLKDLDLESGEEVVLGDTLPYTFLDVNSHADLLYLPSEKCYYAVTVHQIDGNSYEANIYSIASPVLPLQEVVVKEQSSAIWKIMLISVCLIILLLMARKIGVAKRQIKKKAVSTTKQEISLQDETVLVVEEKKEVVKEADSLTCTLETPVLNTTPGIYMLNGFQVINRDLKDITGKFTPIMRQLLSVIILYSNQNNKGISNLKLKELLWFDKSEESFSNNRSVNIRKIRLLLEEVGDTEISSANGYWYFFNKGPVYNDYTVANQLIAKMTPLNVVNKEDLEKLLNLASFGQLLPNMQFDWVDGFKANYSDSMIELLSKLRDSDQFVDNDALKIQISNCILRFDSLDEESVRIKCRALVALKRMGMAYAAFDQFTKEYKQILNEDFNCSFEQFISLS